MEWTEIKDVIRANLLARGLKKPRVRLHALDRIEKLLAKRFPSFTSNPTALLDVGKDTVAKELALLKKTGVLNGAEKSVLNEVFARLAGALPNPSGTKKLGEHNPPAISSQRRPSRIPARENMDAKLGLAPVVRESSRILILGTLPGDDSLRLQRYYAHGGNQFWKILAEVYGEATGTDYSQQLGFLHRKELALWDVLQSAERAGSLDSGIRHGVTNDFAGLFANHHNLKAIVLNGSKAHTLFKQQVEKVQPTVAALRRFVLPSSSPTPGKNVLPFEQKVARWKILETL